MVERDPINLDRRQFILAAGATLVAGAVAGLAACTPSAVKKELEALPVSAIIGHNPERCAGCGVCGLMCSLYNEGESGPTLSRSELVRDPFTAAFTFNVCQQCRSPGCYLACPKKDSALCIDQATGVKYVVAENCDGCGKCVKACPFKPARIKINSGTKTAFKCDLCRNNETGPVCIANCTQAALYIIPGNERV